MNYKLKSRSSILFQILVYFNFAIFTQADIETNFSTLISVAVYSRHGQRTPLTHYPKDPLNISWPAGPAQLLNNGKQLNFKIGQFLRKRYNGFLPEKYSEKDILIKASEQDRVMMSAAATLAGLYPPIKDQIWKEDLLWQPIPIYLLPEDYCYTILLKSCDKIAQTWIEYKQNHSFYHTEDTKTFLKYIQENAGIIDREDFALNIYYIWDILQIQDENNYTLPQWTKQVYPNQLKKFVLESFRGFVYKDLLRLSIGGFFNEMMNHFKSFQNANNSDLHLMKMYFAHDVNIEQILYAINNWNDHIIGYGATVIFELHKINKQFYVQAYYLKDLNNITRLEIEKGVINYPIMKLDNMLSKYYVGTEDLWKEECKIDKNSGSTNGYFQFWCFLIFIAANIVLR